MLTINTAHLPTRPHYRQTYSQQFHNHAEIILNNFKYFSETNITYLIIWPCVLSHQVIECGSTKRLSLKSNLDLNRVQS